MAGFTLNATMLPWLAIPASIVPVMLDYWPLSTTNLVLLAIVAVGGALGGDKAVGDTLSLSLIVVAYLALTRLGTVVGLMVALGGLIMVAGRARPLPPIAWVLLWPVFVLPTHESTIEWAIHRLVEWVAAAIVMSTWVNPKLVSKMLTTEVSQ